ncbi:MAG: hypothetical protein LBR67_00400 [Dysgonamonadaceae bacterium]|jgi:hypothetical protein|nr:hypothetical protein [Dysgonamonadaceae bacterium]
MISSNCFSQEWREEMANLIYTPAYFGPNAFPIPEVLSGKIISEYQVEARYDYHYNPGDKTQDLYFRSLLPFGKKSALEISGIFREYYYTSEEVRNARHALHTNLGKGDACYGDAIVTAMFQLVESDRWMDILLISGLKTASGNRLHDARHTDAASYWFSVNPGRDLFRSADRRYSLRLAGMVGFYCYMTNLDHNRQNDAFLLGGALQSRIGNVYFEAGLRGFQGYWDEGDHPLLFATKIKYRDNNHAVYIRYQEGLDDYEYKTVSVGYIFCF